VRVQMVMVFRHVHGNTARHFDFDFSEAVSAWTTMNADELLDTRRIGRAMVVLTFLSFCWTEGEPAHVGSCLAAEIRRYQSRIDSAVVAVLLAALCGGIRREKNWARNLKVALVGRGRDMDCGNVDRNGALKVL
jgi:hypothetical protein